MNGSVQNWLEDIPSMRISQWHDEMFLIVIWSNFSLLTCVFHAYSSFRTQISGCCDPQQLVTHLHYVTQMGRERCQIEYLRWGRQWRLGMDFPDKFEATFSSLSRSQGANITNPPIRRFWILLISFFLSVTEVDRSLRRYCASSWL